MAFAIRHHHRNQHLSHVDPDCALRRHRRFHRFEQPHQAGIARRKPRRHPKLLHRARAVAGARHRFAQIEMRIRILRGKLCGGAKFLQRGLRVSHLKQHDAQIIVRRGGIRSAVHRLAQFGLRIRLVADRVVRKTQL